jgi:phosphate-selective porin OprO/OprP
MILLVVVLWSAAARAQDTAQPPPAGAPAQPALEGAPPPPPADAPPPPTAAADTRLEEVDQRSRILERKLELLDEQAAGRKSSDVTVTVNDRGFAARSADGAFAVRLRGLLQADGREFVADDALALRSTFVIRKARPILEATLFDRAEVRFVPDFGNGQTVLQDAYADLRLVSGLSLRGGKWKPGLALERAQGDAAVVFPERGLPTFLSSNREVGFAFAGAPLGGAILYEGGIFNGGLDNGTDDLDTNQAKDFIGRLFFQPWKGDPYSPLTNFGFGIGGSTGIQRGTPAAGTTAAVPQLPSYRTIGQQTFFSYASDVVAHGRRTRWSPQGYWYLGPVGVLGEFIETSQKVLKASGETATLKHRAWQAAGYLVIGGKPLYEGTSVNAPFNPSNGTWGALELAVRYGVLDIDDATFPTFSDPKKWGTREQSLGAVLNWHWNRNVKLPLSYEHTVFKGGASGGDRTPENVLFQRIQIAF